MTHICVSKRTSVGSDNGLLIGPLGTNFSENLIEIHIFSFKKIHLKMSSGKRRPFCLDLNVLTHRGRDQIDANFADGIFKCISLIENFSIAIQFSLKFVPTGPINPVSDNFLRENINIYLHFMSFLIRHR